MKTQRFRQRQRFARPLGEVFEFFSDATNLERITPPFLRFQVLTRTPIAMFQGQRIDYRLKVRGIPIRWTSEISVWEPPHRFIDRQVRGPYRLWVHSHRFWEAGGETWMEDDVEYAVLGGDLVRRLLVEPDIRRIFEYRSQVLETVMNSASGPLCSA